MYHQVAQTAVTVDGCSYLYRDKYKIMHKMFEFEVGYQKCIIESVVSSSIEVRNSSPYGIPHHNAVPSASILTGWRLLVG